MNNLQKIASLISGYEFTERSARDGGYYESDDQINYLQDVAFNGDDLSPITKMEALEIDLFLSAEMSSNERYHAFRSLGV